MRHSRVLVYGAGVIGTFYAELLAAAGEDVSLLARGRRLEQLRSRKDITVLDRLDDGDRFDFIFVAVRCPQPLRPCAATYRRRSSPWPIQMEIIRPGRRSQGKGDNCIAPTGCQPILA